MDLTLLVERPHSVSQTTISFANSMPKAWRSRIGIDAKRLPKYCSPVKEVKLTQKLLYDLRKDQVVSSPPAALPQIPCSEPIDQVALLKLYAPRAKIAHRKLPALILSP